ncbi:MAG: thioredoxin fold domain-containing protein, partial [Gammaproteobacteria bacterium]|nr:thioredoxin fold domain-containing protein [Gammaproteobacteria bacterium]
LTVVTAPQAKDFNDGDVAHIVYPDWLKKDFLDLEDYLSEARSRDKHGLMVLFTTEGCSYCDAFIKRSLGNPELVSTVRKNFDSVGLEIFDDAEMTDAHGEILRVKQFAKREGAEFAPTLTFYGDGGERVLRVVGYQSPERFGMILDYVSGGYFRTESLRDYLKRTVVKPASPQLGGAARLKDDPLFTTPPYALDRRRFPASRPLLVIFEEVACDECAQFHEAVLSLPEVRELLKGFEIVRLDAADANTPVLAPDGSRVTPAAWFQNTDFTRVPALLFFDKKGNEVLKTDALVLRQRMMNSLLFVLERAYEKGWTYQRLARSKGIERNRNNPQ